MTQIWYISWKFDTFFCCNVRLQNSKTMPKREEQDEVRLNSNCFGLDRKASMAASRLTRSMGYPPSQANDFDLLLLLFPRPGAQPQESGKC